MTRTLAALAEAIDRLNGAVGRAAMWLALAMALAQFAVVVLRYVFSVGFVPLQESVWYMNGVLILAGAAYALASDSHVRVDLFYRRAGPRRRAAIDLAGALAFLMPFCVLTFVLSLPYAATSWRVLERSREVGGLPGIFLLKTAIPLFAVLLGLQAAALALRSALRLAAPPETER